MLALIDKGKTWVKLSGAYADTKVGLPTYADATAVAQVYTKRAPERCVWGSDWPHPGVRGPEPKPDGTVLFDLLLTWRRTKTYVTVFWSRTRWCVTIFRRMPNQFSKWEGDPYTTATICRWSCVSGHHGSGRLPTETQGPKLNLGARRSKLDFAITAP